MTGDKIPADQVEELADCFMAQADGLFGYAYVLTRGDRALAEDLVPGMTPETAARKNSSPVSTGE